ncbi:MAG: cell wall hydrolase [Sphingomonas sp.]
MVTLCAGTLANAATLDPNVFQDVPLQQLNPQEPQVVPAPPIAAVPVSPARDTPAAAAPEIEFTTLSAAVAAQDAPSASDDELRCLAVGVYYEAKGEPLAGQLAVADVILNRTTSGRFPRTVCSVLTQRGQFSFVRGGKLPSPPSNAAWRKALAVAQVARKDLWESPVEHALYFHAGYVSPNWKRARVGMIGHHVFYR